MNLRIFRRTLYITAFLLLPRTAAAKGHSFQVMAFNVENLFDTKHDNGKEDWDYLPTQMKQSAEHKKRCSKKRGYRKKSCLHLNWNQKALDSKMSQLAKIILASNGGKGPDVLIMPEVENIAVLETFRKNFLQKGKYLAPILVEGDDYRGIDVGILSRFPLKSKARIHPVVFKKSRLKYGNTTRPIVEADFALPNKEVLTVFGVHFPSPAHPHGTRVEAFEQLKSLMKKRAKQSDLVIAAGDFNVKAGQDTRIYRSMAHDELWVSHYVGCETCLGTNYYKPVDSWSFLDAIMVHKQTKWRVVEGSVRVISNSINTKSDGRPLRFNAKKGIGVSDHLPLVMRLERK